MPLTIVDPAQIGSLTTGADEFALTVMVNCMAVPVQVTPLLVYDGVTVKVDTMGLVPVLVAVKPIMLPVPLVAARPISPEVRLQAKVEPATGLVNTIEDTLSPSQ